MITQYEVVQAILKKANGTGNPGHGGKKKFWDKSYPEFIAMELYGQKLIEMGKGAQSNLIKSLKGEKPFDGSQFQRMPQDRPPVCPEEIQWIEKWIDDGCPNDSVVSPFPLCKKDLAEGGPAETSSGTGEVRG